LSAERSEARPRVLHVIQSVAQSYGGPTAAVLGMCRAVRDRGIDAEIFTTNIDVNGFLDAPLFQRTMFAGVPTTFFPPGLSPRRFRLSLPFARGLAQDAGRFDLLHIHSLYNFPALVAAWCCRRLQIPYIIRPHGTLDPYHFRQRRLLKAGYEALIERRNLAAAAAVHFTSDEEMRLAQMTGWTFKGVVAPLGVDVPPIPWGDRSLVENRWPRCKGKRIVLFLGRLDEKKGLDLLIAAFANLMRRRPDLHLLIAGPENDDYGLMIRRRVLDLRIEDCVTFAGMVTGETKASAFAAAELFVLPSHSENFGVAVAEAMAAGLPVVVSEHVNLAPRIVAAGAGIAVPLGIADLQAAMAGLLDDPALARETGHMARALAQAEFSWDHAGARLAELYRSISGPMQHPPATTQHSETPSCA
jgi:glycosyltransferase involved in cell wall biosynthesis